MIKYFLESGEDLSRASRGASGYDLRAAIGTERVINVGERWLVSTGLYLEMPEGVEGQVRSRSGLSAHHGVIVLNAPGTIDADYRGEVKVLLINLGTQPYHILPGDRIAQLVFAPVLGAWEQPYREPNFLTRVRSKNDLSHTDRGDGGHGSTGR